RAARIFELSPLETAAKAKASAVLAWDRVSRSKPIPVIVEPLKSRPSLRNASGSRSTTAMECPFASRALARDAPTRHLHRITKCSELHLPSVRPLLAETSSVSDAVNILLLGRPIRSADRRAPALNKRIAKPVFASDMLSSVHYAPDENLLALSLTSLV